MQQLTIPPEAILQSQQETISQLQQQNVMLRAAIIHLTKDAAEEYREGDDPVTPESHG